MFQDYVSVVFDGPAGVGKSTIAKAIALKLGFDYVDTGAMYRAVTLFAMENGLDLSLPHQQQMLDLVLDEPFRFIFSEEGKLRIFHGSRDLTDAVRTREVSRHVSYVAALPWVRKGLTELQRQMAAKANVVMEGRDIGTVVMPNATYKFFLTASPDTRAQRRFLEMTDRDQSLGVESIRDEIIARDTLDSSRTHAPLVKAEDAIEIDTSCLSIHEVVALILSYIT
jgi:cytidylate kinase